MPAATRRALLAVLGSGSLWLGLAPTDAMAQDSKPSGSVSIHLTQVAFLGSGTTGGGTLKFQGKSYRFNVSGLGIGGIGVSTLDASGNGYGLKKLADFSGVYGQARTGWAAGQSGKGQMWLENPNGVYLRLTARRKGVALSLGADGMVISLK